jgi:hypothetical protein
MRRQKTPVSFGRTHCTAAVQRGQRLRDPRLPFVEDVVAGDEDAARTQQAAHRGHEALRIFVTEVMQDRLDHDEVERRAAGRRRIAVHGGAEKRSAAAVPLPRHVDVRGIDVESDVLHAGRQIVEQRPRPATDVEQPRSRKRAEELAHEAGPGRSRSEELLKGLVNPRPFENAIQPTRSMCHFLYSVIRPR